MIMLKIYLGAYGAILITFLIADAIWLGVVSKDAYQNAIGNLMRDSFIKWPFLAFYIIYSFVILYLAVLPNGNAAWTSAAIAGAVLGLGAYGTYNLTCYGVLEGWPLDITIKDLVWGTFATALSATSGWFAFRWLAS